MTKAPACSSSWLPFATTAAESFRLEAEKTEAAKRVTPTASKERRTLKAAYLHSKFVFRSLEDGRHGATKRIQTDKAESWPQGSRPHADTSTNPVRSRIADRFNAQMILDSSPDEVFQSSPLKSAALSQSTTTGTDASNEVVTATQEVVLESDDEDRLKSERFLVDENTRLQSGFSSTEKQEPCPESDSGDSSESSDDEEDNLTRRTVSKMSLTGAAREFADYLLARQSERVMARRDRNMATVTYDVVETVSMYGFSISWLSPKAIMYGPSFARDPATVTLALPLETFPNELSSGITGITGMGGIGGIGVRVGTIIFVDVDGRGASSLSLASLLVRRTKGPSSQPKRAKLHPDVNEELSVPFDFVFEPFLLHAMSVETA
ncbi:unnamed protein product [Heligmosomoides polygyrus]|uniref:CLP1_P domain-containing protein n=1 Tax=Heligmosomoides polygyrus TaxID=6339 RepID=A0A3P8CMN9_HELPZ|nr:unnamed protein product [Heligmosomoides polygyrus]